jgi:hypothetical protein
VRMDVQLDLVPVACERLDDFLTTRARDVCPFAAYQ